MTLHLKRTRSDGVVVEQPVTRLALGDGLGLIEVNGVVTLTAGNSQQAVAETSALTFAAVTMTGAAVLQTTLAVTGVTTLTGQLITSASTTARAGIIVTHGAAPTGGGLVDGGLWSTTAGFFGRVNGATVTLSVTIPVPVTQGGTGLSTIAAGRLLYASATDVVAGLAPTANRVLVADGSMISFTTIPFAAMPAVAGTWDVGAGNTLTVTRDTTFSNILIVAAGGVMRLSYRADPAGPSNGDVWINSTSFELKYRANGATYRVVGVTP